MNAQEIIEGNKLIAEFVDLEVLANPHLGGVRPKSSNSTPVDLLKTIYCEIDYVQESVYPQFNSSWDWLMPVVIKMANTPEYQNYFSQEKLYFEGNPLMAFATSYKFDVNLTLESVFEEVVGFIKWYNTL